VSNRKILTIGLVLSGAICGSAAQADVTFHGFGQVIVGSTLDNNRPFPNENYTADPDFQQESLFALQASAPLSHNLSATAQILAQGANDYSPKFQWAYISWAADEHLQVNAGRQVLPFYKYSDFLSVGQAYQWIRPPVGVYNLSANNFDGLSFASPWEWGNWYFRPQVVFGKFVGNVTYVGSELKSQYKNLNGLIVEATYNEWLSFRAGFSEAQVDSNPADPTNPLIELESALSSAGLTQATDELTAYGDYGRFLDLAIDATPGQWLLSAEYTTARVVHSIIPTSKQYYVSVGRHFGKWTPMLTWSRTNTKTADSSALTYIPVDNPYYPYVQGALADPSLNRQDHYYEFGLRYDVTPNVALKLDYTGFQSPVAGVSGANLVSGGVTFSF